jgi:hypothetical protein
MVALYKKTTTGEIFAVKFAPLNEIGNSLLSEQLFMKEHCPKLTHSPRYIYHSAINGRRFIIMQNLDHDLDDYIMNIEPG